MGRFASNISRNQAYEKMKKCKFEIIDGKCVIPEGVTELQNRSFSNCDKLKEVSLPSTVKCIHNEAFYDCWGLTSVEISAGVTTIEPGAFLGCPGIETIRVAEDNPVYKSVANCCLTKDGKTLVFGCKTSVIPDTVETIARSAFQWCEELAAIHIPPSVKSINSRAFFGCLSLRRLTFTDNGFLAEIGDDSFSHCPALRMVTLPESITGIGKGAFAHCINLWSINIPQSVEHIADGAFYNCPILSNFTLPDTVTSIGHYAFCGCHNLEGFTIPASVKSIGSHAFAQCGWHESVKIPGTVEYLGPDVSSIYVPEEIVIPDKLEPAQKDPYELPF